jgi:phage gpG-like protein
MQHAVRGVLMSAWEGNISELGQLAENLDALSLVPSRAARRVSGKLHDLIVEEFARGEDPYGDAWAPLEEATIEKGREEPPLTDTGAMVESLEVKPMAGAGVSVSFGAEYAGFHHEGTVNMVARKVLPDDELPQSWNEAIYGAASEEARNIMVGGR